MLPASLLLPHLGSCGRLVEGVVPDALLLLFCCRTSAVAGDRWKGWFRMPPAPLLLSQSGGYRKNGAGVSENTKVRQQNRTAVHPGGTRSFVGVKG